MTAPKTLPRVTLAALLAATVSLLVPVGGPTARAVPDPTAPDTRVDSSPASPTRWTTASFVFRSSEPNHATFECSLDGGTYRPCKSPVRSASLVEGRHSFRVRAIDAAGNAEPTPAARSWTIDLTAPETLLTVGEGGTSGAVRFEFSADESVRGFYCSLDGGTPSRCSSPREYGALATGDHEFRVHARDKAGNDDPTPEAASWTVTEDRAPVVSIEGAPRIESYHEHHYFRFSADVPGSDFHCSLDDEPFAPCASGAYRHVPYGRHTFSVYAVSPGGTRGEPAVAEYESRDPNWD